MKPSLIVAASLFCLASAAAAAEPAFNLRLEQKDGDRKVAVSNAATGAFAVAAGGKELDLLAGDDARAVLKRLNAEPDLEIEPGEDDPFAHAEDGKRKIIVHKMDYDEDETGDEEKREIRIVKRHHRKSGDDAADIDIENEGDDDVHIAVHSDGPSRSERRVIVITGADAGAAVKFIDQIEGLDAREKQSMKSAVGL